MKERENRRREKENEKEKIIRKKRNVTYQKTDVIEMEDSIGWKQEKKTFKTKKKDEIYDI